jgi:hypothetical protein
MLDQSAIALLDIINLECNNGGYKVFFTKDLLSLLPAHLFGCEEQVLESIKTLAFHQYISVKYQDQTEICLCPLVKGRLESESRLDNEIENIEQNKKQFLSCFFGAFLGGFCALLLALLFNLVGGR